jgi:hypothetical protein
LNTFLKRIYEELDVTCQNCEARVKIMSYEGHWQECGKPKCKNEAHCVQQSDNNSQYCGDVCMLFDRVKRVMESPEEVFRVLDEYKASVEKSEIK